MSVARLEDPSFGQSVDAYLRSLKVAQDASASLVCAVGVAPNNAYLQLRGNDNTNASVGYTIFSSAQTGGGLSANTLQTFYYGAGTSLCSTLDPSGNLTLAGAVNSSGVVSTGQLDLSGTAVKVWQGATRTGTFTANSATPVAVSAAGITTKSVIVMSISAGAGANAGSAVITGVTPGNGFQSVSGAADTSTYNWFLVDIP